MSDTFKPTPADHYTSSYSNNNNSSTSHEPAGDTNDMGRTVLAGVVGGLLSAAGYLVYQRLPDEQKEKLHGQVKGMLAQRISELRNNFNI